MIFQCSLNQFLIKLKVATATTYFWKNARINQLENNKKLFFHDTIMMRFGEIKVAKGKFYAAKKLTKNENVNRDDIIISKVVKAKTLSI